MVHQALNQPTLLISDGIVAGITDRTNGELQGVPSSIDACILMIQLLKNMALDVAKGVKCSIEDIHPRICDVDVHIFGELNDEYVQQIKQIELTDLAYADDLQLLSSTYYDITDQMINLQSMASRVAASFTPHKSKLLYIPSNKPHITHLILQMIEMQGVMIQNQVVGYSTDIKILGTLIDESLNNNPNVTHISQKINAASINLKKKINYVLNNKMNIIIRLLQLHIRAVAESSAQAIFYTSKQMNCIFEVLMRAYKNVLSISPKTGNYILSILLGSEHVAYRFHLLQCLFIYDVLAKNPALTVCHPLLVQEMILVKNVIVKMNNNIEYNYPNIKQLIGYQIYNVFKDLQLEEYYDIKLSHMLIRSKWKRILTISLNKLWYSIYKREIQKNTKFVNALIWNNKLLSDSPTHLFRYNIISLIDRWCSKIAKISMNSIRWNKNF